MILVLLRRSRALVTWILQLLSVSHVPFNLRYERLIQWVSSAHSKRLLARRPRVRPRGCVRRSHGHWVDATMCARSHTQDV